jgi:hypothetical protein
MTKIPGNNLTPVIYTGIMSGNSILHNFEATWLKNLHNTERKN